MIVQDKLDPSGMFSKAGRLSLEMYTMLQEKDFIMDNKRKMQKLSDIHIQQSINSMQAKQQNNNERHRTFMHRGPQTTKSSTQNQQPFFKMVSRDQYQQSLSKLSSNNQKFGMYNPKYHLIYEKSPLYPDLESQDNKQRAREFQLQNLHYIQNAKKQKALQRKQQQLQLQQQQQLQQQMQIQNDRNQSIIGNQSILQNQSIVAQNQSIMMNSIVMNQPINMAASMMMQQQQQQNLNQSIVQQQQQLANNSILNQSSIQNDRNLNHSISEPSILGIDFDKPRTKINGPIPFDKQAGRKPMVSNSIPHDKRFEYLEIPSCYSKSQRLPNISFDTQKRDDKVFGAKTGGLDYNVNDSLIHPRSTIGVLDYSKISPRKYFERPQYTLNERACDDYLFSLSQSKSQILKKVSVPKFDRMAGRNRTLHENKLEQLDNDITQQKSRYN